ncbi:hypothetical protein CNO08_05115 [Lysobacter capsici]|nr:hypothetical protein CNO08_05115 [Lysobacter capsici]
MALDGVDPAGMAGAGKWVRIAEWLAPRDWARPARLTFDSGLHRRDEVQGVFDAIRGDGYPERYLGEGVAVGPIEKTPFWLSALRADGKGWSG